MPKRAAELKPLQVKRLSAPGLHAVGGVAGLHLQITPSGARSWVLRYRLAGKRRDLGLGPVAEVSLSEARQAAREARHKIREGIDPVAEREAAREALRASRAAQAKTITFDKAVEQFLRWKSKEFTNAKHQQQWANTLASYASPIIGNLSVDQIELAHIVKLLQPIWEEKTETASRVRQRVEAVLAWATVSGYRTGENPARWKGNLDSALPKPEKIKKKDSHHPSLPYKQASEFFTDLGGREGTAARCLELVVLTGVRSGEARMATWSEIDLDGAIWTIPGEHTKTKKEHLVPLSDAALALLRALPRMQDSDLVFTAPRGGKLSDAAMKKVIERMHIAAQKEGKAGYTDPKELDQNGQPRMVTPHGMRSTLRDWVSEETNHSWEIAEMALAHTIKNKAEKAYRRGNLLAKRSRLMQDWASYLHSPQATAEVVSLHHHQRSA